MKTALQAILAVSLVFFQICYSQPNRPNIVLILLDDLDSYSIAYMPQVKTLLVDQGTSFANFFVSVPVCCPSRASFLRGQYAHNHGVLTNHTPDGGFVKFRSQGLESSTIATWLHDAGYRTALFGTYLNGYPAGRPTYIPQGWDEWYGVMYSNFFNYSINENGQVVTYGSAPQDYETDVLARHAADFIRRTAPSAPFFIYFASVAPHEPAVPAPRHQNEFLNLTAPRLPSFNEADVSDKPAWVQNQPLLTATAIASIDTLYRKRLQTLVAVDEMIKNLVDTLSAYNELENTYFFFTSDNGYHFGEHRRRMNKNTAYEESIRVPLIVRGPGVAAGRVLDHLVMNIDLGPTFAELAGATAPDFVDGRSLMPLLHNVPPTISAWRHDVLIEHWIDDQDNRVPEFTALRTWNYTYVEYPTGERELYDLRVDPFQLQSLHATADPALLAQLAAQLDSLRHCSGGNCFPVGVAEKNLAVNRSDFRLEQNYPNPFNPSATINFYLPKRERVTLTIYELTGRQAAVLVDAVLDAGEHHVAFDSQKLAGGVWFYQLKTPSFSQTRKAMLLR